MRWCRGRSVEVCGRRFVTDGGNDSRGLRIVMAVFWLHLLCPMMMPAARSMMVLDSRAAPSWASLSER